MAGTRKIAAIMVGDVVGYSRLIGADEEGTLARLLALRSELFIPNIEAHGGRVVSHAGDGVVVEFRSVVEAVRCALDVTRGLADRNAPVPADRRIEVPPASTSATSSRMRTATSSATPSTSPRGSKASARRADSACRKTPGARCATGSRKPSSTSVSSNSRTSSDRCGFMRSARWPQRRPKRRWL